jgi:hypothetical protein
MSERLALGQPLFVLATSIVKVVESWYNICGFKWKKWR